MMDQLINTPASLAKAAISYALRQRAVFPLKPGQKTPLTQHGYRDASSDLEQVRKWWMACPNANIGCASGQISRFWSLDIDGQAGVATLGRLEAEHGALPKTVILQTGRGWQYFWSYSTPLRCSAALIGDGIDVRADGGYTILPPSVHPSGQIYRWAPNSAPALAVAPGWLFDLATPPTPRPIAKPGPLRRPLERYVDAAVKAELSSLETAREGYRNHALNKTAFAIAGFVKAGAVPEEWARQSLEARATTIGLTSIETRKTIDSAFRAAPARELPR